MKKIIILAIASLGILGCNDDNSPETTQVENEIAFEIIQQGEFQNTINFSEPQTSVITNQIELEQMKAEMVNQFGDIFLYEDDFSTHYLLYIVDIQQPDNRYSITIESIYENTNSVTVNVSSVFTDGISLDTVINPFIIVKIPKTNKPINFVFN
nr:protease complex subunit PrcB family protein [uncultured Flavobacterium sp.]